VTVTTDFETHRLWVNLPCERFFTATEEGSLYLHSFGVPAEKTRVTGIPIHPNFAEPRDRAACLQRHGLVGDRPIVLQLAGGFGVGPVVKLYEHLLRVRMPIEIIVVAGRNEKVRGQLGAVVVPERHRAKVLGFTDQIDELMAVADLVMSKPGGLTTSESLARGVGMVIVNPIPGQESRNSDYLLERGAAIKVNNLATLAHKIESVLDPPDRLAELKSNARKLGRPHAAFDIVNQSLELIGVPVDPNASDAAR
jgi:processive 1,2-diacylglycerol beta-glucosyltransferase